MILNYVSYDNELSYNLKNLLFSSIHSAHPVKWLVRVVLFLAATRYIYEPSINIIIQPVFRNLA